MDMYDVMNETNMETISKIEEAREMIGKEEGKEHPNESLITRLMMEQLLRGIYLR